MASTQIRISKTPELEEVLAFLKEYYKGLTENEVIKKVITEDYRSKNPFPMFPDENISPQLEKELIEISEDMQTGHFSGPFSTKEDTIKHLQSLCS